MESFFSDMYPGMFFQCIPDRFSVRRAGTQTTPESWHQDISVPGSDNATVFGGWVNLDSAQSQFFSCVPGSHLTTPPTKEGFAKIKGAFEAQRIRVEIPPQHCIVFFEQLVHEVLKVTQKQDSYRLYLKYMITADEVMPFENEIIKQMSQLGVPPYHVALRKNKRVFTYPGMYGGTHVNFEARNRAIEKFTESVKPEFRAPPRTEGVFAGKIWVSQILPSLKEVGMAKGFPDYNPHELAWFKPHKMGGGDSEDEGSITSTGTYV